MAEYYSDYTSRKKKHRHPLLWLLDVGMTVLMVGVALATIITLFVPYVHPEKLGFFPVLGLLAPGVYILTVILTLYWIIRWRWVRAGFMLFLAVLGFFHVSLFYRPEFGRDYGEEVYRNSLRVMSYNLRWFYDDRGQSSVGEVMDMIDQINPDVVCLQEFNARLADRSGGIGQIASKYQAQFFEYSEEMPDSINITPMCILSKYKILRSGVVLSPRNSVWVDLDVEGDTVRVFNNHLLSTSIKAADGEYITNQIFKGDTLREERVRSIFRRLCDNSVLRANQVDSIARFIDQSSGYKIVCGDFNDAPMSYAYHRMSHGLNDVFSECGSGYSHTYRGFYNTLRIDYVLVSPEFECLSYDVPDSTFSDHYPVVVNLRKNKK